MKPYEFKRFYHPKLGKFVHVHKGSGIIVDNIFKPMKSVVLSVARKFAKKSSEKAMKSGISHLSNVDKKTSEKSGDLIREKLRNMNAITPPIKQQQQNESTDMFINRLISGDGVKRRRK